MITEEIKSLSDERALTLDEVDRLLTRAQEISAPHQPDAQPLPETEA
jgi:hypothetical protein